MKIYKLLIVSIVVFWGCSDKDAIKKEIISYHICMTQCDEIGANENYDFYKCAQGCVDLCENRRSVCHTMKDPELRTRCLEEITIPRDQCLEVCRQNVIKHEKDLREKLKRCKENCLYQLKK
jgi:hypothetical protein